MKRTKETRSSEVAQDGYVECTVARWLHWSSPPTRSSRQDREGAKLGRPFLSLTLDGQQ